MKTLLTLTELTGRFAVCRLDPGAEIPAWSRAGAFVCITRTADELSIVCPEESAPPSVRAERGLRALKIEGPFDLSAVGILSSVAGPLARNGVSILAIGTYDTDYVLVRDAQAETAFDTLEREGHKVNRVTPV